MNIEMRRITSEKVHEAVMIWNKVVEDGVAFPRQSLLMTTRERSSLPLRTTQPLPLTPTQPR